MVHFTNLQKNISEETPYPLQLETLVHIVQRHNQVLVLTGEPANMWVVIVQLRHPGRRASIPQKVLQTTLRGGDSGRVRMMKVSAGRRTTCPPDTKQNTINSFSYFLRENLQKI